MVVIMTQDEIIEMAKEAGMIADGEMWFSSFYKIEQDVHISHLKAFAKLVAQHEREACAKEAEKTFYSVQAVENIRARG
jgi:hypothetical protein